MKRIIVSLEKLTPEIFELVSTTYPNGYKESNIVTFTNSKGQFIRAVEVRTEEVIYLVKISAIKDRERELEEEDFDDSDGSTSIDDSDMVNLDEMSDED